MTTLKSSFFQTYLSTNKNEFKKNQNPTFFFAQYLKLIFPDIQIFFEKEECFIKIPHKKINKVFVFLNKHSLSQSKALMEICAVDYPENIKRFDIYYNLLSLVFNNRLNVVISISVGTAVSSLTSLYKSAGWMEREVWDFFGIFFSNHSDLRRILTDYGFKGHPLRKDFPLSGYTEVLYNDFEKKIDTVEVSLAQAYRNFYVSSFEN